jgi:transposase
MSRRKQQQQQRRATPQRQELPLGELLGIVERAKAALSEADYATLRTAVDTLAFLTQELAAKGTTIERLRKLLFGASTEKTSHVVGEPEKGGGGAPGAGTGTAPGAGTTGASPAPKPKAPGHGRNGAVDYPGATKVKVPHASLVGGAGCPCCQKGKVYPMADPAKLLRVRGMAPLAATVYEKDRLRCNLCGEVFTAESPEGVGEQKYDETATGMIGLLKYGVGVPFHRLEKLEKGLGIPLPAATQWELVEGAADLLEPAHAELVDQAAQGDVLHNDDTTAKILELSATPVEDNPDGTPSEGCQRTGIFTTGVVSQHGDHKIALFFTGRKHAGENLEDVLRHRAQTLAAPIQMCDALSRNLPGELQTILAHCIAHARRRFVDVASDFPDEVRYLLETLGEVYKNDALARKQELSPDERLRFHQAQSGKVMAGLKKWLHVQIAERKVEPNSGLGDAIGYMRKHWRTLTLFLRKAGAPLDNNICERALKKAILHRKNALFYRTQHGAHVGDIFMSLIHSAELNGANAFDYLVALQRHHEAVAANPADWMPWNYQEALARLGKRPTPPG